MKTFVRIFLKKDRKNFAHEWYIPSIGVGVFLSLPKEEKILVGKRIRTGLYGLPGGWLEFGEEWEDAASRELNEETGLAKQPLCFDHVFTLNCHSTLEKNQHNISCIMYSEVDETESTKIVNKEPHKCSGWMWVGIEDLRRNINSLFYPLRDFLNIFKNVKKATDIKSLIKKTTIK